jgi:hypothetical protein
MLTVARVKGVGLPRIDGDRGFLVQGKGIIVDAHRRVLALDVKRQMAFAVGVSIHRMAELIKRRPPEPTVINGDRVTHTPLPRDLPSINRYSLCRSASAH